jgi:hypothetical protein
MTSPIATALSGAIRVALIEFLHWREAKAREEGWVPSAADIDVFLSEIEAATPEAVKAEARERLGIPEPTPETPPVTPQ